MQCQTGNDAIPGSRAGRGRGWPLYGKEGRGGGTESQGPGGRPGRAPGEAPLLVTFSRDILSRHSFHGIRPIPGLFPWHQAHSLFAIQSSPLMAFPICLHHIFPHISLPCLSSMGILWPSLYLSIIIYSSPYRPVSIYPWSPLLYSHSHSLRISPPGKLCLP